MGLRFTRVTRVKYDSDYGVAGEVEITIRRLTDPYPFPDPNDIPPDFLDGLAEWLDSRDPATPSRKANRA